MKNILIVLLIICISFIFPLVSNAQSLPQLNLTLFNDNAEVFYIGDIDFAGLGNAPNIFNLQIDNSGSSNQFELSLRFEMIVNSQPIMTARSDRFTIPSNSINNFTNQALNTGTAQILNQNGMPTGEFVELKNYNVNFDLVENLEEQVLSTGKLPAGTYNFSIEATIYENGAVVDVVPDVEPNDNILTISNPITLEPLYPGSRVGDELITEIPTPFPYFLWQSDATKFNLFVYEKYAEDQSIQDVLSHDPMLHLEGYPNQIFQYPTDPSPLTFYSEGDIIGNSVGPVRLLEPGNIYYWYVQAVIITASGENTLNSDVYRFKVSTQDETNAAGELIMTYLRQMLGDRFGEYLQALQGYEPTGNLLLNNAPVDFDVLADLIQKINQDKVEIQNITIE